MISAISVIIPTYNRQQSLKKAILSVIEQSLPPLEILVCDDGSSIATEELVAKLNDQRVKWLPGEHAGRPAIPRNRGIQAAKGDWLAFLDDDDYWLPEKLEYQFYLINKTGCLASCSNSWRVQSNHRHGQYFEYKLPYKINFNKLLETNYIISSSSLIERKIVQDAGGFPETESLLVGEDYALWLKIASFTDFSYCEKPLLEYTDEPETSIRKKSKPLEDQKIEVFQEFINWPGSNHKVANSIKVKLELFLLKHPKLFFVRVIVHMRWRLSRARQVKGT